MFNSTLELQRRAKGQDLAAAGRPPYPHFLSRDKSIAEFRRDFAYVAELPGQRDEAGLASVAGRVKFLRQAGRAIFAKIEDQSGDLQLYFSRDSLGEEAFGLFKKNLEVGDLILARGFAFITKTGEFSLHASTLTLAAKAICPLPEKFHGLTDIEQRYRKRYLDLIMNPALREDFITRSRVLSLVRGFFEDRGFIEVETPMLHPIAGGAAARPFATFHNALGVERFLRIAPELYLKRLIVGGFEAVFELNRCFRNEGMDHSHNPEFTTIEFYWAYHNYLDLMSLTEELLRFLLAGLNLGEVLEYEGMRLDFSRPFERIRYEEALIKYGGLDEGLIHSEEQILARLRADGHPVRPGLDLGGLWGELFDRYVEDKLAGPVFITHFPISLSPLARRCDEEPQLAERFELFIAGKELANGFNELNDPLDQHERFLAQLAAREAGDEEASELDEDFIQALGYGMPPTAGEGIGLDRLVMILTNKRSIRDVLLFPALRPETKKDEA